MNSKEIRQQADELIKAKGILEGLGATIKELRNAEKEIDQQACVLYYEASCAERAEEE